MQGKLIAFIAAHTHTNTIRTYTAQIAIHMKNHVQRAITFIAKPYYQISAKHTHTHTRRNKATKEFYVIFWFCFPFAGRLPPARCICISMVFAFIYNAKFSAWIASTMEYMVWCGCWIHTVISAFSGSNTILYSGSLCRSCN